MTNINLKRTLLISIFAAFVALAGCQEKGPAEKAGEKIDNAIDGGKDSIEDAADDVEDAADDAADEIKDATN